MERLKISKYIQRIFETDSEFTEWFGYYNYDTLNYNQTKMLCNRAEFDGVKITKGMTIELGYYDIPAGKWHHIGESDSFNWQQGAMMQWLHGKGNENKVIYNCSRNNQLVAVIHDIETGETKNIDWTIYGITPDGKKSISLNLERSYWCRAYHYQSVVKPIYDVRVAEDDGIFEIDLENNTVKRIVDIQNVINIDYEPYFDEYKHWLEHIMINPTGTKFVFLHRFSPIDNIFLYQTRIFIANIDGSNLQIIPDWKEYSWSHFGWQNDNDFCIYCYTRNKKLNTYIKLQKQVSTNSIQNVKNSQFINQLLIKGLRLIPKWVRKKIKGQTTFYQLYTCDSKGRYKLNANLDQPIFDIDGHPSFTKDGRYMITDSYPDKKKYQYLIIYDILTKKSVVVGKFYASFMGNPASCDLHPKLCADNEHVVVDSAYNGKHRMIVFKINWDKVKSRIS